MPSDERERQSGKPTGDGEPQAESGKLKHPGAGVITRLTARQHVWLLLVFVLALGFRGAYLWSQASNNPLFDYPQMDGRVHHEWAQQIASGEGMEKRPYLRAPLYYHLLGLLYSIVGPKVAVARIVGILEQFRDHVARALDLLEQLVPWSRQLGIALKLIPSLRRSRANSLKVCRGGDHAGGFPLEVRSVSL